MGWSKGEPMDKIMLTREGLTSPITRRMTISEQQEHHKHIIGRANQSITAMGGFADNTLFWKAVVQEAHMFTDKRGVVWAVSLTKGG